ncbi:hypothetical protein [Helicobacter sp. 11S02629-2]|uniref:hypothetical protein n=1 Tax=Helicobacter sp. 11S02629-2 TaxID=1476195 RepID=UPI000BA7982E|nr:hypothetical protein [Helicobacter sp. 11S02629-2]PAF42893.1 hypothetical protein BKH40_07450 [Helicobacter sp. 11S02629-2]
MKRLLSLLLVSSALSSALFASPVVDLVKKQTGLNVKVLDSKPLKSDKDLSLITLKDEKSGTKTLAITNKEGSLLFGLNDVVFSVNKDDSNLILSSLGALKSYNSNVMAQAGVKSVIASLPKQYIITLPTTNKAASHSDIYIVSDPMCPHCQAELKDIHNRLKEGNVHMILIGWLSDQSAYKAKEIYDSINTLKTEKEKIALLDKIYNPAYKAKPSDVGFIADMTKNLTGPNKVQGVPYIIKEDN